jgi:hypothetical protein
MLGKEVSLHRCPQCDLLFFPDPDWLEAAYSDTITEVDIGLPTRCLNMARVTEAIVRAEKLSGMPHLDYGGGYGLMTRFVRDRGIDMYTYDPYARNLFAQHFEAEPDRQFGVISLVEVLEHLTDPREVVQMLAEHADVLLVSTLMVPPGMSNLRDWWYLLPHVGQHVTFYSEAAMRRLAESAGLRLTTNGGALHVMHRRPLRALSKLVVRDVRLSPTVGIALRPWSKIRDLGARDTELVTQAAIAANARRSEV